MGYVRFPNGLKGPDQAHPWKGWEKGDGCYLCSFPGCQVVYRYYRVSHERQTGHTNKLFKVI